MHWVSRRNPLAVTLGGGYGWGLSSLRPQSVASVVSDIDEFTQSDLGAPPRIAILLPCDNEGRAIGMVVGAFRLAMPDAEIFVYDNNSTDNTAASARHAGAVV